MLREERITSARASRRIVRARFQARRRVPKFTQIIPNRLLPSPAEVLAQAPDTQAAEFVEAISAPRWTHQVALKLLQRPTFGFRHEQQHKQECGAGEATVNEKSARRTERRQFP